MIVNHEIPPYYDEDSTILILGSIPSVKSREEGFYYAHPQNRFWPVLALVFSEETPLSIDDKKAFLRRNHIALWDTLASCEIKGSFDSSISSPKVNDIMGLLQQTKIKKIYTTGRVAYNLYNKYIYDKTGLQAISLPSTSPANCRVSKDELVRIYKQINTKD